MNNLDNFESFKSQHNQVEARLWAEYTLQHLHGMTSCSVERKTNQPNKARNLPNMRTIVATFGHEITP